MSIEEKQNSPTFLDSENIVYPQNEKEVSNYIKKNYKSNTPIELIGSGSKRKMGKMLQCGATLSLSKLNGIVEYFPEELYIKVKSATPIKEIEDELNKNNQYLPFEPIDFGYFLNGKSDYGTAAGQVACNITGSRRFKVGSVRDHVLGFQGINGKGEIIKSGGTVVKNVTGYDLSKLITGSFGTLSILTEITLKVLPKKKFSNTIVIDVEDHKKIYDLFNQISGSSSEVSGAVFIPNEPEDKNYKKNRDQIFKFNDLDFKGPFLAFRIEGDKISINEKIKSLTEELQLNTFRTFLLDSYQSDPFWKKINNLELFEKTENNLLRIVIEPSNGSKMMKYINNKFKYYIDWCGSLFWIEVPAKKNMKVKEIKKMAIEFGGYLTIIKTSPDYDYDETIFTVDDVRLMISKKIKKSFDPKRILNPGKMYRGV